MRSAHPNEPMTQHLTKLSALTLCLLSALPVAATPNVNRELQLETEERLEQVSEELRKPETSNPFTFEDGKITFGGDVFFHYGHGHRHDYRTRIWFDGDDFSIWFGPKPRRRRRGRYYPHGHHRHNHCSAGTGYQGCHYHD